MDGFTPQQVQQAVIDDLWALEVPERIKQPPPYVTTVAGTLTYSFDADNEDSLTPILPGISNIRRIRGIYKPALTNNNISDYNYRQFLPFDQNLLTSRLYDGAVDIDNELRTLIFRADPDSTTTTWKLDYYPEAPILEEDDRIPVLPGWEMRLVLPGMRAFAEEWKSGESRVWRPLFDREKDNYFQILRMDKSIPMLDENLFIFKDKTVEAQ